MTYMNNEVDNTINVELNPDTITGFLLTTQGYEEQDDDKRKKPTFYWKAYHLYPFVITEEDYDPDEDTDPSLAICVEGGDKYTYNFVPMLASDLKEFIRSYPSFRIVDADDLFGSLNII